MKIGQHVIYDDPEHGASPGTVTKLRDEGGFWVRLDRGERVLAFPEECREDDHAPLATRQDVRPAAVEPPRIPDVPQRASDPTVDVRPVDVTTAIAPDENAPDRSGQKTGQNFPQWHDPDICPACRTRRPFAREVVRGGFNHYVCMERFENGTKRRLSPGEKTPVAGEYMCGATWTGDEAAIPDAATLRG